jgi:hypothetical protein
VPVFETISPELEPVLGVNVGELDSLVGMVMIGPTEVSALLLEGNDLEDIAGEGSSVDSVIVTIDSEEEGTIILKALVLEDDSTGNDSLAEKEEGTITVPLSLLCGKSEVVV